MLLLLWGGGEGGVEFLCLFVRTFYNNLLASVFVGQTHGLPFIACKWGGGGKGGGEGEKRKIRRQQH